MKKLGIALLLGVLLNVCVAGTRQNLPMVSPEQQGFDGATLQAMTEHFQQYIDEKQLAGLTTLIARKGEVVHFHTYGQQDDAQPMADDTLFRIYSMTKPITGVAMLMLWEQGKYQLDDPVSKYLPAFANQRVFLRLKHDGSMITRPVRREATIRDLMRHTAGLSYGFMSDTPVDKAIMSSGVFRVDLQRAIDLLGGIPLRADPGDRWIYSLATDVQGRLVEVLSGQRLDEFFRQHIFEPLNMDDTVFTLKEHQYGRLSEHYVLPAEGGAVQAYRGDLYRDYRTAPVSLSGGGGLVSSTYDYWRFTQMLANKGVLDGVRLLQPSTVEMMTRDQLPAAMPNIWNGDSGERFGLNVAIVDDVQRIGGYGRVGEYNWAGMANTLFWVDPTEDIVAILMVNIFASDELTLRNDLRRWVYTALEKGAQ